MVKICHTVAENLPYRGKFAPIFLDTGLSSLYKRIGMKGYIKRGILDTLKKYSAAYPCLLLTGARQVGKSTLLQKLRPKGMEYVTLDDFAALDAARRDPAAFLEMHPAPLMIDEIQYAPELFRAIKKKVDEHRRAGMYWMSGSQRFSLMQNASESLAGRVGVVELCTLSQREILRAAQESPFNPTKPLEAFAPKRTCGMAKLYERIWLGGFPEMFSNPAMTRDVFFPSYVQTYIERDVNALTQVGNRGAFFKLLRSAAARTGQTLSYSALAQDSGVSVQTAKRWVSILATSGIIYLLEPYAVRTTQRLVKSPVLHFMDTGLCAWLLDIESPRALMNDIMAGHFLETWVFGQLWRSYANAGLKPRLNFFRNAKGAEVDLLLERGGVLYPMEVKRSLHPVADDLKGMRSIPDSSAKIGKGIVFCPITSPLPLGDGHLAFPVSSL